MGNFHTISRNGKASNSDKEVNGKYPHSNSMKTKHSLLFCVVHPRRSQGLGLPSIYERGCRARSEACSPGARL